MARIALCHLSDGLRVGNMVILQLTDNRVEARRDE